MNIKNRANICSSYYTCRRNRIPDDRLDKVWGQVYKRSKKGESLDPNFETTVIPTTQGQDRNQSNGLLIAAGQWKYRSTKRVREGRQLVVIFWERGTGLLNTSPGHHLFSSCFLFIYQFLLLFLEYQSVRFSLSINFSTPYFEYSVFLEIFCLYF